MKDLETKLFVETHTKDVLQDEKIELQKEFNNIKTENQNMGRTITKDKYHNNRDEQNKQRMREIETLKQEIIEISEQIEVEQAKLQEENERNADPHLLKKQNEVTMNL